MTHKEIVSMFVTMRGLFVETARQASYKAADWRSLAGAWHGVFSSDPYTHVWAGVRMYIRGGGKWWPTPGEVAALMPCDDPDDDALRGLSYMTRQALAERREAMARREERDRALNPWR